VLDRDISINNLLFTDKNGVLGGLLIDYDYAFVNKNIMNLVTAKEYPPPSANVLEQAEEYSSPSAEEYPSQSGEEYALQSANVLKQNPDLLLHRMVSTLKRSHPAVDGRVAGDLPIHVYSTPCTSDHGASGAYRKARFGVFFWVLLYICTMHESFGKSISRLNSILSEERHPFGHALDELSWDLISLVRKSLVDSVKNTQWALDKYVQDYFVVLKPLLEQFANELFKTEAFQRPHPGRRT
jgi:hypothetical protein